MQKPASRPNIDSVKALRYLTVATTLFNVAMPSMCVLGIRGYYLDSIGKPGENERGEYDDAIVVIVNGKVFPFNGNTDPSRSRPGMAVLKPGVWQYKPGTHGISRPRQQQYPAFVQAGQVTVIRDGQGPDTGEFGINIHRGGVETTSSLGCQTIPPDQWEEFRRCVLNALARMNQRTFSYVLIEETQFRKAAR